MRITVFGAKAFDSLEYHVADSLRVLGHEVTVIDLTDIIPLNNAYSYWAGRFISRYAREFYRRAAARIVRTEPALVICTYRFIEPVCVVTIKNELPGVPVVQLNPDAVTTFENQQVFASPYDMYFTKDPYMVRFMRDKMGKDARYLPEAFNPRVHKPTGIKPGTGEGPYTAEVVSFGNMYAYRSAILARLAQAGIQLALYGNQDKRYPNPLIAQYFKNEYITGDKKAAVLGGAKIVFNNFHYAEIECVNVKFFEIWGSGAFQICDYKPVVDELSAVDARLFTFNTTDEAIELVRHYLDKPAERREIAEKQYNHFLANHTYEHRMAELLMAIGL